MRRIRFALMGLLLILALGSLGVAYALWSETLQISGTVNTGVLDASWINPAFCQEFYGWPGWQGWGEFGGKDVGSVSISIDQNDSHLVHFTITNGYPSYAVDCSVKYNNTGTIPWKVESITFSTSDPDLTGCTTVRDPITGSFSTTCDQLAIVFTDGLCEQVDPGNPFGLASNFKVHVEQGASELATYDFALAIQVNQWNESSCP